jgi:signal transduction histidine kinase
MILAAATATAAAADEALERTPLLIGTQAFNFVVLVIAVVVVAKGARDRRTPASRWALAMFSSLALICGLGFVQVTDDGSALRHGFILVLIAILLLVPYFLLRFAHSLGAVGKGSVRAGGVLTVLQLAWTPLIGRFPGPGEPQSTTVKVWVALILTGWSAQTLLTARGLWTSGKDQPSVVRNRMRVLSAGAVIIALSLVSSSAGSQDPDSAFRIINTLVAVVGISCLVLAFVVPDWMRAVWRAKDLTDLGKAERSLMAAVTPSEVGEAIVPALIKLFGARGAALVTDADGVIAVQGMTEAEAAQLHQQSLRAGHDDVVLVLEGDAFACRVTGGSVVLQAGTYAPLFGPAELALLDRVGSFVDLALQRSVLFAQEARSRHAAEAANAELQTLVYSVSHDLRNPIISVLGYLDVLAQEHAGELQGEGAHYLERISVNAMYMQSLIQDLLELSRIGRSEPAPEAVSIGALADSVSQEVRVMNPECHLTVSGEFPVVWMSELRARQLLTNLIDNAAKHARGVATVTVTATRGLGDSATVLITDNGKGVPAAYREKAFDVFERLDAARTDIPGTGMGLPICKRIVESVGGSISLEGPPDGAESGTVVRIVLPGAVVQGWHVVDQEAHVKETVR